MCSPRRHRRRGDWSCPCRQGHHPQVLPSSSCLPQIGSYYGSEINSLDVNGDGVTDVLLVGAPMYFSEGRERGKVYVYTLQEVQSCQRHHRAQQHGSLWHPCATNLLFCRSHLWSISALEFSSFSANTFSLQNHFVSSGALEDLQSYQNSRFGSCIAAVPDLNQDSYNDVVIGAPLEDDHQGAIYVFLGFEETILKKYKQVQIPGLWLAPFFISCAHGR